MAAWLIPAVKAILPFISPIVSSALPVFTTRKSDAAAAVQTGVLQQQITELQSAQRTAAWAAVSSRRSTTTATLTLARIPSSLASWPTTSPVTSIFITWCGPSFRPRLISAADRPECPMIAITRKLCRGPFRSQS